MPSRLMKRQVRTIAASTLTTSYQAMGALVTIAAYKISIVNASSTDVQIQDQTFNDVFYIPAMSTLSIGEGLSGSGQNLDKSASVPANTTYMVKLPSGAAGTGVVVVTVEGY